MAALAAASPREENAPVAPDALTGSGRGDRERLRRLADRLEGLVTEALHPAAARLDTLTTLELLELINREEREVAPAVACVLPAVAEATERIVAALRAGGRLFYLGAGTSGRLGVLDASECPPTFGVDPSLVTGVIAGGEEALRRSSEGIEDEGPAGWADLERAGARGGDVVVGITASTRTPYVVSGLVEAGRRGLTTVYLTCNPQGEPGLEVDVTIAPVLGPEVIAGSTRLKAGTATKMILNLLTTASFVRLGKTWGNLMVDVRPVSDKLRARARRIVMLACGVGFDEADRVLRKVGEESRAAILVLAGGFPPAQALELARSGRPLRDLLGGASPALPGEFPAGSSDKVREREGSR
jgi:N-acetylmuramic acid 6-phosphate etherase